jgi:GT2 family glycosyltransferase
MDAPRLSARTLVTVVIVNFNGRPWLGECLAGLRKQVFKDFQSIVVDNGSEDGSVDLVRSEFPEVRVIQSVRNLGFAAGVNLALSRIETEFVALLNPDTIPQPDWLEESLRVAMAHPEAAAVGCTLLMAANHHRLDGIGDVYHLSGWVWREGHGRLRNNRHENPREIFAPSAAAALYRTVAVKKVGGMDESLFCYLEDVDLGFRLRLAGFSCLYAPKAHVYHVGSAIAGRHSDFQTYYGHRNIVWVYFKNMPDPLLWLFLPLHLAMNLAALALLSVQGRGRAAWRAKRDALLGLPAAWRKRREVQEARSISVAALLKALRWLPRFA